MGNKYLVICYKKSVGDTIIRTTLCDSIKKKYPDSEVHYLVYKHLAELLKEHKTIDKVISFKKESGIKGIFQYFKFLKEIRKNKYDIVIDCRSIFITAMITFFSKAKLTIGKYKKYRNIFYNISVKGFEKKMNQIEKYHQLLVPLEIKEYETRYTVSLSKNEIEKAREILEKHGINENKLIIPMNIVTRHSNKAYPIELMIEVIKGIISKYDAQIIFVYTLADIDEVQKIYKKLDFHKNIFADIKTSNLRELASILKVSDIFVGNEGGARHVAEAVELANLVVVAPQTNKSEWLSNENYLNQCIDVAEVEGEKYEDITPKYILEKLDRQLKHFNYFNKKHNKGEDK